MIKMSALMAIVCLGAFANPLLEAKKFYQSLARPQTHTKKECPNFSGNWKGSCEVGSEKTDVVIPITQADCGYVQVGNLGLSIGGSSSQGMTHESGGGYQYSIATDWDGSKLVAKGVVLTRGFDKLTENGSFNGAMEKEGDRLRLNIRSTHKAVSAVECELEK